MLSRPTTEQILRDCCTQLREKVLPALHDDRETAIAVQMMEEVLRNCAVRAAHEIAWMREEIEAMLAFAHETAERASEPGEIFSTLKRHHADAVASLHLDDVIAAYGSAGACFEAAVDAVLASGEPAAVARVQEILDQRLAHENEITGEWGFVGRA